MIAKLRSHLPAQSLKPFLKWFLLAVCIVSLIPLFTFLHANPDPNFWFVPDLPVPAYATHIMRSDNPLDSGSMGGYRIITFVADQPVEMIKQFYRTELAKRGWYFVCTPTQLEQPGCPLGLSPEVELAEAYKRDDEPSKMRAINLDIYKPGENLVGSNNRFVEVIEYRYPLPKY